MEPGHKAFLDANVIRGQLTTDVLLSVAHAGAFEPRWSQGVLDEMRRNRPPGLPEAAIERRIKTMNTVFPKAMVAGHEHLIPDMQADDKDRHVLAAAVHSNCDVLVTENTKDFNPPANGPGSMRVETTSQFLGRLLDESPQQVVPALEAMVDRNKLEPRTMPELMDRMNAQGELARFAQKLNPTLPPEKQGTDPRLATGQEQTASSVALDGLASPQGAVRAPGVAPEARQGKPGEGPERGPTKEV